MEELEGKSRDEVVLDEVLLFPCGQHHVHKALLLEEDEPVEAGEEDDAEEDIGQVSCSLVSSPLDDLCIDIWISAMII